jgi:ubiquinone/menaquinone biosynthesis C-methylase UbiE
VLRRVSGYAAAGRELVEHVLEHHADPRSIPIRVMHSGSDTEVDRYWTGHTVNSSPFRSAGASLRYLDQRAREYPRFESLMELRANHETDVVLDYGCGPGNDLVGFLMRGKARRVIGIDISPTSLDLARRRLALHDVDPSRVELIQVEDGLPAIPLVDASVDYLYCEGVIHHTSHPLELLRELSRVLRPGGRGHLMVYNRNSIWFHLYTAYQRQIIDGAFAGLSTDEAFRRNTDGEECPIARPYVPADFENMCRRAGFEVAYRGGYPAQIELDCLDRLAAAALKDPRLADEHRTFLAALRRDERGDPTYGGFLAGVGGVYAVSRP